MDGRTCVRCGAEQAPGVRFCTACGLRQGDAGDAPAATSSETGVAAGGGVAAGSAAVRQLVECEVCGAGNAASRALCARCGSPMREEVPGGDALPDAVPQDLPGQRPPRHREGPSLLLAVVILAGLFGAGVLLALVTARVTAEDVTRPEGIPARSADASSSLEGRPPSAAIDGDPATAWVHPALGDGDGDTAWLEVVLVREAAITGLLVWNGDQADERRFTDGGRAAVVRIEVGDRAFRVALRDLTGPQSVDLPEAVTADRVRIVIEEAVPGRRHPDVGISEILVEGA